MVFISINVDVIFASFKEHYQACAKYGVSNGVILVCGYIYNYKYMGIIICFTPF